ncbi:type 1 fimbrial protein [Burkholderia glumae]|uniref:fimbrial protein n=1 Tax=Burkholderia glumae TaxID=337 RepID=UPI002164BF8D|nr:fimbrial protein [Burkholderia glumae]UVS86093.1 type 1 fimbrial protein [Burkholderia glumae]
MQSKVISVLLCTGAAIASQGAFAADGLIIFTGNVTAQTCTISGNGTGSKDFTVALPSVQASALPSTGSTAGATPFSINLTNCVSKSDADAVKAVHAYFESGPTIDTETGNLILAKGGAAGVEIQLLNAADQSAIKLGQPDASQNSKAVSVNADGTATLRFYAQYYATGTVTPGSATSNVMYTIAYE